jgi:predicted DNA-binding transcriptional regulator YafY
VSRGGRDQLGPIERLVRILAVLDAAGESGATQDRLLEAANYDAEAADAPRRMLNRDVRYLNEAGWDIKNVAAAGADARYVLRARDIRLRVELSPGEQAELARVGRLGGIEDFADYVGSDDGAAPEHGAGQGIEQSADAQLAMCLEAAALRRVVQFIYKGQPRTVHPRLVQPGPSGWYLVGWEQASGIEKYFVVDRIRNLVFHRAGTAMPAENSRRASLDPATWEVDPPVEVEVETSPLFADQVKLAIRPVVREVTDGDRSVLTVRVTNRAAFRTRLYALGTRVRVLGPYDIRAEIVDELTQLAGVA